MKSPYNSTIVNSVSFKQPINGFDCLPAGMEVSVTWDGIQPSLHAPLVRPEPFKITNKAIAALFGLNFPNLEQVMEWSNDGVAESVLGESVEPDGYDKYGSPSWLLTLGVI